jgi:hypothetical protein
VWRVKLGPARSTATASTRLARGRFGTPGARRLMGSVVEEVEVEVVVVVRAQ